VSTKFDETDLPTKSQIRVPAIKILEKTTGKSESPNHKKPETVKGQNPLKKKKPPMHLREES